MSGPRASPCCGVPLHINDTFVMFNEVRGGRCRMREADRDFYERLMKKQFNQTKLKPDTRENNFQKETRSEKQKNEGIQTHE